jgi:hypothetical protein
MCYLRGIKLRPRFIDLEIWRSDMETTAVEEPEHQDWLGAISCVIFVPAVMFFSFVLHYYWPYIEKERTSFAFAIDPSICGILIGGAFAGIGVAFGLRGLTNRLKDCRGAILGIALNCQVLVGAIVFALMWLRSVWRF